MRPAIYIVTAQQRDGKQQSIIVGRILYEAGRFVLQPVHNAYELVAEPMPWRKGEIHIGTLADAFPNCAIPDCRWVELESYLRWNARGDRRRRLPEILRAVDPITGESRRVFELVPRPSADIDWGEYFFRLEPDIETQPWKPESKPDLYWGVLFGGDCDSVHYVATYENGQPRSIGSPPEYLLEELNNLLLDAQPLNSIVWVESVHGERGEVSDVYVCVKIQWPEDYRPFHAIDGLFEKYDAGSGLEQAEGVDRVSSE